MTTASVTYGERHGWTMVRLAGDLDAEGVNAVRERLRQFIAGGCRDLVVDLGALDSCDSGGFAVLVATRRHLVALGGRLRLVLPPPGTAVRDTLTVFGIDRVFEAYDHSADAISEQPVHAVRVPRPLDRSTGASRAASDAASGRPR